MRADIRPGSYVVAVSGGVDSMVLLHLLAQKQNEERRMKNEEKPNSSFIVHRSPFEFVVAHYNHGIRRDAHQDEELVSRAAKKYGLMLEVGHGRLGKNASEETARKARYGFLEKVRRKHGADVIITAHHQDDLLETAIINLIRGTGRRGLTAIMANPKMARPLLNVPKSEIIRYAKKHGLEWIEDPTNRDESYLRNYIRRRVIPVVSPAQRQALLARIKWLAGHNPQIDEAVEALSQQLMKAGGIDRRLFTALPAAIADELVAYWLRRRGFRQFDRRKITAISLAIKSARPGTRYPVTKGLSLIVCQDSVNFTDG